METRQLTEDEWRERFIWDEEAAGAIVIERLETAGPSRVDAYSSSQPRDNIGRFAGTGALEARISDAGEWAHFGAKTIDGKSEHEAQAARGAAERRERSDIAEEDRLLKEGTIQQPPHAELEKLQAVRESAADKVTTARAELHQRQQDAIDEVDELRRFEGEYQDVNIGTEALIDHWSDGSVALDKTRHGLQRNKSAEAEALPIHRHAREPHPEIEEPSGLDELLDGDVIDSAAAGRYRTAEAAAERLVRHHRTMADVEFDVGDQVQALREGATGTAKAIRELSRITKKKWTPRK